MASCENSWTDENEENGLFRSNEEAGLSEMASRIKYNRDMMAGCNECDIIDIPNQRRPETPKAESQEPSRPL
jgi:hypothetical protein